MSLKLKNIIEIYPFTLGKLLTNEDYIEKEITSVNIIEVPTVAKWMKGGELLFSSGYAFQGNLDIASQIILDLAEKQVAALVIKPGIYLNSVPQQLIDLADSVHLPIIQIPEDMPYSLFMQPILEKLINEQIDLLIDTENIHNVLLETLVENSGISGVCEKIYTLTGINVVLFDNENQVIASNNKSHTMKNNYDEKIIEEFAKIPQEYFNNLTFHKINYLLLPESDMKIGILPIDINRISSAYLCFIVENDLTEYNLAVIHYADTIFSIFLQQQRALIEKEWQLKGECLDELIWQNSSENISAIHRAEALNIDLHKPFVIVIFDIFEIPSQSPQSFPDKEKTIKNIQEKIHHRIRLSGYHHLVQNKGNTVVVLFSFPSAEDLSRIYKTIEKILELINREYPNMQCVVGIGKSYIGPQNIRISFKEARTALKCGKGFMTKEKIFYFEKLGEFRFLFELKDSQAMLDFFNEHMSALLEYDQNKHTDLVLTLKTYFDCQCNIRKTAEALFTHKNTVIYRLRRIEQLTGHDLSNSEDIFQLYLCLKLMIIIQQPVEEDE